MDYDDRGLAALPKLVGGPKYTRPPLTAAPRSERPPDPDDLPLASVRTPEEQALAQELGLEPASPAAVVSSAPAASSGDPNGNAGLVTAEASSRRRPSIGGLFRDKDGRSGAA